MVGDKALKIASAILALCLASAASAPPIVEARDYTSFWLWAGVPPQPVLETAERIYLLQGEVADGQPVHLTSRRAAVPHVRHAEVWLVVRTETLAWPDDVYKQLGRELARWRMSGTNVVGVQIDFDASTRHLDRYAAFLKDLRLRLPDDCKLGITGLLDWSANGDPVQLNALAETVDEAVLQIYQGRHVIPAYATYIGKLDRLKIPFRIGLLQGGEWEPPASLSQNAFFRGYVVFLRKRLTRLEPALTQSRTSIARRISRKSGLADARRPWRRPH